jgi:TonB dependent receptor
MGQDQEGDLTNGVPRAVGLISYRVGFFAQDDIKVTQKLTLNIGARYDIMPYPREMHDRLSNFDPANGTMLIAGQNTSERLVNTDYKDLAPRVGLAYSPSDKTVIRAGYGIGFIDPYGAAGVLNSNEFNVPFYNLGNTIEFPFTAPTYKLSSTPPSLEMPSPSAPTGNQRYIVPTDGNQYSQTWSFTVQRAINRSLMFEAAYVGTSGNRLLTASDINAALPGTTNPTTRQPFGPALGEIRELSNSAHSIYHGLQSKIEKRFSGGLYFLGSYTWSKSIDNQSNGTDTAIASGQYPQDPLNARLDRGLSSFDRPQVFVGSFVWEIPFGRGPVERSFARDLVNHVLGGWQMSGIFTAESGTPFSVLMSCADINAEGDNCRPNRIAGGALPSGQGSINEWFDTAAFVIPSTPEYGSAGRNILRAPGLNDIDLALSKSFLWGHSETRLIQIRSDFFNTLNRTNLGVPVNSIDSPAFGTITSSLPGREIQLGARLQF